MTMYKFECGCEIPIVNETIKPNDGLPSMEIDYYNINHNCPATWSLFCEGKTKGIFQLEKSLGKSWSEKVKPVSIEEVSALVSLIRPGCISYDTEILTNASALRNGRRHYKRTTIENLYNSRHLKKYKNIVSYNEDTGKFISNEIEDIILTGIKPVFKIKLKKSNNRKLPVTRYNLKCTNDHKLLTSDGWKELKDMVIGDRFAVFGITRTNRPRKNFDGEKHFRTRCYQNYKYKCVFCDWNGASLDVNHLDGNRKTNNSIENIHFICPNHHKMYTEGFISKEEILLARNKYKLPAKDDIEWAEYLGKEYVEDCKVYDITMKSPHHNFIAGNIVVHNCLKSVVDGKSMTRHFVDRKNGEEEFEYFHPSASKILDVTHGVIVYQEQTLALAKMFAGFDLVQADMLRRAIGKKKADVMAQCRIQFIEGCDKQNIIDSGDAEALFDIIEKSNRYSFNKAHGTGYAETAYWCAYAKAHFPLQFFCSWLSMANDKQKPLEEVSELVQDAKSSGINILGPSLFLKNEGFIIEDKQIRFGVGNVKGVGKSSVVETLLKIHAVEMELKKAISEMTWYELLIYVLPKLKKAVVSNLIGVGALSKFGLYRNQMLFEYIRVESLTDRELNWIKTGKFNNVIDAITALHASSIPNVKRKVVIDSLKQVLIKPPSKMNDSIDWVSNVEETLLGISLTCSKLDACDVSAVNCTCKELSESSQKNIILSLQLDRVSEWRPKDRPDPMAFLTGRDSTGSVEMIVSQKEYKEYGFLLFKGNTIIVTGNKNKDNKLSVKKVAQI